MKRIATAIWSRIRAALPKNRRSRTSTKSATSSTRGRSEYAQAVISLALFTIPLFMLAVFLWLSGDEIGYWQICSAIVVFAVLLGSATLNWILHQERKKHEMEVERLLREISRKL